MKNIIESAGLKIMRSLTENKDMYDLAVPRATGVERHFKTHLIKSLNESADLLIMKSLTKNADSCDLSVPRETGVERHFKRYLKDILNLLGPAIENYVQGLGGGRIFLRPEKLLPTIASCPNLIYVMVYHKQEEKMFPISSMIKSLNESPDLLIMSSLTENADSCDLAVHRETGVQCHFKRYFKDILNQCAYLWIMKNLSKNALYEE